MQPDGRGEAGDVEDHLYAVRRHLVHNRVEPRELETPLLRLEGVPGQVTHTDHVEPGLLHHGDVAMNLLRCTVDRLVAGTDEELPSVGPFRDVGTALRQRG